MEEFIARANIERFTELLAIERDPVARGRLKDMLAAEEVKLRRMIGLPVPGDSPDADAANP